jgi:putative phage-type endonuclease
MTQPLVYRYRSREEWLAGRRLGIGASEAAGVLGQSPWHSPWKVWAEKVAGRSLDDDIEENEAAQWGLAFERPIAERFSVVSRRRVELPPAGTWELYVHPERPWLRATPDAWQWPLPTETHLPDGEPGVLQVKMAGEYKRREWRDGPPLHYEIQVQHEMAVTGALWGSLIVLIGGNRLLGPFDMLRNDEFIDTIVPFLHSFWRRVETQTAPELDGSEVTARAVAKLYAEEGTADAVHLDEVADRAARELVEVRQAIKALESRKHLLKATIINQLKHAPVGILPSGGRVTYRTTHKKGHFVKPKDSRVLRVTDK